jgi:two-component system NtrC family sensor kinase
MRLGLYIRRFSLQTRLLLSYGLILGIGGLATSVVGSWIVSSTIMMQARRSVDRNLTTARTLYEERLRTLERTVQLATSGTTLQRHFSAGDTGSLLAFLSPIRQDIGFDFLGLTDPKGRVILRVSEQQPENSAPAGRRRGRKPWAPTGTGDDVSAVSVIRAALGGKLAAGTEILPAGFLANENPQLAEKARIRLVPTERAKPGNGTEETSGMVLIAAAPARAADGSILGALYGGVLLNRNAAMVDRLWTVCFKGDPAMEEYAGTVTIFQGDLRISTNVKTTAGERAVGTRVSEEVSDAVLGRGEMWRKRSWVVDDWYLSAYDPIRNYEGKIIGILYVGVLEKAYTWIRDRVIISFFGIASIGFILIMVITYYMVRSITLPILKLVGATQNVAAGRFDQEVQSPSHGELAILAASFNSMTKSLRQMKADLEDWGRTLEEKVRLRTEELMAMRVRVEQSERLASLGMLAAGIAHEINNPLGGVLALTKLALEDMPSNDSNRENLDEVVRQAERCRDIVRRLLEFSRQSESRAELVDVNEVLEDTLSLIEKQALFFNVKVVKGCAADLPPVLADSSQLGQVFMNLFLNAVQAMEERGTITVVTRCVEKDDMVEILVSDTGAGIPPEQIGRIFDPFFTTKPSGKGSGLGLSIAYGIVTTHQGTISVSSEVGKGTTFTIRFRAAARVQQAQS